MNDHKKQKSNWLSPLTLNWRLLMIRAVLVALFIFGAFGITPIVVNRAKTLKCEWTGFCESTTREETRQKKDKTGSFTETIKYQSRKTLWDWLELAGTLAVPILIAVLGYQFQQREKKRAEEQAELEREIAKKNSSEEAIQAYLDSMAKLLLDKELRKELFPNVNDKFKLLDNDNPVRDVARTRITTILRRLEGDRDRQVRIIHFLRDAELDGFILKNANLSRLNLWGVNLTEANLTEADLGKANLEKADLLEANLEKANLRETKLEKADLWGANLTEADLLGANLRKAKLVGANLERAKLEKANLKETCLIGARNLTSEQIKSACFWEQAIYKKDKKENQKHIEELKKDKSSQIVTSPILGPLSTGESESWEVILTGQRIYNIFVQAHEPDVDFKLYVYDESGNLIDMDNEIDSNAYSSIITNWTGAFQIVIECARGFSTYQLAIEDSTPKSNEEILRQAALSFNLSFFPILISTLITIGGIGLLLTNKVNIGRVTTAIGLVSEIASIRYAMKLYEGITDLL